MSEATAGARRRRFAPTAALRRGPLALVGAAVIVWFAASVWPAAEARMSPTASGLVTLGVMLLAAAYAARRRSLVLSLYLIRPFAVLPVLRRLRPLALRLDQLRSWRLAHLFLGALCVLPFCWHVQAAEGALLETLLLYVVVVVIASGVIGVALQYLVPQSMLQIIEREVREQDVEQRRRAIFVQAEESILGRAEPLVQAYLQAVRPVLQGEASRWRLLEATLRRQDPGAIVRGRAWRLLENLDEKDAGTFRQLIDLAEQKGRLDLNMFHLQITTGWLSFHTAAVTCVAALTAAHILSVLYFGDL